MKKLIIFLFTISFLASCDKKAFQDDIYQDSEDTEINDENNLTINDDDIQIEERASKTTVRIDSIVDISEFTKTVQGDSCTKYDKYQILAYGEGNHFKICGHNFGDTIGTVTAYITKETAWNGYHVISWSDSLILFDIDNVPMVRNVVLKITVKNAKTQKTRGKSIKCVGANFYSGGGNTNGQKRKYITYPLGWWEIVYNLKVLNKDIQNLNPLVLDATYVPQVGDVLERNGSTQFGIIVSIDPMLTTKGEKRLRVFERNRNCKGRVEKKYYNYKAGLFPEKVGETKFTKAYRPSNL